MVALIRQDLQDALGLDDLSELAALRLDGLLAAGRALASKQLGAGEAPEASINEALIRFVAHSWALPVEVRRRAGPDYEWVDLQPQPRNPLSRATAWRSSGAAALLAPFVRRRGVKVESE